MAKAKVEEFTKDEIDLAEIAKSLSHPARIRILKILFECNTCITGDIVDKLPLAQSTVSQHLKELKKTGIIDGEIEGPKTCYCINNEIAGKIKSMFNNLFTSICKC